MNNAHYRKRLELGEKRAASQPGSQPNPDWSGEGMDVVTDDAPPPAEKPKPDQPKAA